jgi:hypothetical protein
MPSHKFKVGELVELKPAVNRNVPGGIYEIARQLPGNGECEYRIKSPNEPHERVAGISQSVFDAKIRKLAQQKCHC